MKKVMILLFVLAVSTFITVNSNADWVRDWTGPDGSATLSFSEALNAILVSGSTFSKAPDGTWIGILDEGWWGYRIDPAGWPLLWHEVDRTVTAASWVTGDDVRVQDNAGYQIGTLGENTGGSGSSVPEPASIIMFGLAMAGGWIGAGQKKKK